MLLLQLTKQFQVAGNLPVPFEQKAVITFIVSGQVGRGKECKVPLFALLQHLQVGALRHVFIFARKKIAGSITHPFVAVPNPCHAIGFAPFPGMAKAKPVAKSVPYAAVVQAIAAAVILGSIKARIQPEILIAVGCTGPIHAVIGIQPFF